MYLEDKNRGTGKTTRLITACFENDGIFITHSSLEIDRVRRYSIQIGKPLSLNQMFSFDQFDQLRGIRRDRHIYVDNIELATHDQFRRYMDFREMMARNAGS
jgi:hypothetical protein